MDAIEAALTPEEVIGFLKGQVIKYEWRSGKKDAVLQEQQKAKWYLDRLVSNLVKATEKKVEGIQKSAALEQLHSELQEADEISTGFQREIARLQEDLAKERQANATFAFKAATELNDAVTKWKQTEAKWRELLRYSDNLIKENTKLRDSCEQLEQQKKTLLKQVTSEIKQQIE